MKALITGATGFVGHGLPALLEARGWEVHRLDREVADLLQPGSAEAVIRDLKPTHLIHLAWYAKPGLFWTAPENAAWAARTLDLYRAFAEAGGRRFVGCGSCAEYGWGPALLAEDAPLSPSTPYGAAKAEAFRRLTAEAAGGGPSLAWGRLFFPYGPGESPGRLVPDTIDALLAGREAKVSEGLQERDFIFVEDAAAAFAVLAGSTIEGAVNVGSGEAVRVRTVVETLARLVGRPELVRWGAMPAREGDPQTVVADVSRLSGELGFRPGVGLEAGLLRTVAARREAMR